MMLMGSFSFVGGLMILFILPETMGKSLPETMEEAIKIEKIPQNNNNDIDEPLFDSLIN